MLVRWDLGPFGFYKLFYPITLFLLGMSSWFCFRQWKLSPLAALLGGLAAELSSHFLSTACWGVAAQIVAVSMAFLAIGILTDNGGSYPWVRVALGGMCVGMCVMEGYDIGA